MRAVPEWIATHDDQAVPPRVRLRIFERHNGICYLAQRKIAAGEPWDLEHIVALCNGGQHRESNLAPALRDKHKAKTREDMAEKSATYHKRARHVGVKRRRRTIAGRKFDGTPIPSIFRD